jgi:hypothetical protein
MKESGGEKKYATITFRPDSELEEKILRGMAATKSKNKSKFLKDALNVGLEVLEQAGWNVQADYVRRRFSGAIVPMLSPPDEKHASSK